MAEDIEDTQTIPIPLRPNPDVDAVSFGEDDPVAEFGEPEPEVIPPVSEPSSGSGRRETYVDENGEERYVGSNRRVRSDRGGPRKAATGRKGSAKGKTPDPAAAGATVLYGGIGAILSVSGLAPAAGLSMQGLADEAGPEVSEWAKKRSPRFYQFLVSLSEASGIGKFIAGPVSAEAYLRMERARPALGPAVVSIHGKDSVEAFDALTAQYDSWKAMQNGSSPIPPDGMPPDDAWAPPVDPEGEASHGG